jgi:ethanolamine permease
MVEQPDSNMVVESVIAEAHIPRDLLLPEEIEYLRERALHKPLRVVHIWSLGVGAVITGMYFGWNPGLPVGGPIGMLIASLVVCVLYLAWVLGLSELSVAMPFAGGPLAYGRRAVGKTFGFLMGWSMFLECLFAAIGTALATGGYVSFLLDPEHPNPYVKTGTAIACAIVFFVIQYRGVKGQAKVTLWLTYAAIAVLGWFWLACAKGVTMPALVTSPLLPNGWGGVLGAVPYALWWLVIIESVALAAEEAHEPQRTIPRGMVWAQITLALLVILTWLVATGAAPYLETGKDGVDYPLPLVFKAVWGKGWFLAAFSVLALTGLVVSYNGMIYALSRQSFSLGRAGYFPAFLGAVHSKHRTPHTSLALWTAVTIGFILFSHQYADATNVAVLISTLTAVLWYVGAMICLVALRRKEPEMVRPYKVPLYPILPIFIALLSLFAAFLYGGAYREKILWPTAALYAVALAWYYVWARRKVLSIAPEEVAARIAQELAQRQGGGLPAPAVRTRGQVWLERLTGAGLILGLLSLAWMLLRRSELLGTFRSEKAEVAAMVTLWAALFILLSVVGFVTTRRAGERNEIPALRRSGPVP